MEIVIEKRGVYWIIALLCLATCLMGISAYNTNDPSYFGHSADEVDLSVALEEFPTGFCIFSRTKSSCPEGFSEKAVFDNRTVRVSLIGLGETGGSETHTHSFTTIKADTFGEWKFVTNIYPASSWPPYVNVIMCCKD